MDHREVGRYWNANAEAWTALARLGYDVYRDYVNTPAFLAMLPDVRGRSGLDVGCGDGHNTRQVARLGARMTAVDIAQTFIRHAREEEIREPLGIRYLEASAVELPFEDESFDFVMATMSLMDISDNDRAIGEASRVLRSGGFFQFSITHPCFCTARWQWVRDERGKKVGAVCGDYFRRIEGDRIEEWIFGAAPAELRERYAPFRVPRFTRTLSDWLNTLIDAGFAIERVAEPQAGDEAIRQHPHLSDTRVVPIFFIARCRKPLP